VTDPALVTWQPHPEAWLMVVALTAGYLYALSAWGPRYAPGRPAATRNQRWCFFAGVVVLWFGADWPVHYLAEGYLYSVHMFQHLLFQLVGAPLLILGTPAWLLRRLLRSPAVHHVWRGLTRPLVALVIVFALTAALHVPAVVNTAAANPWFHLVLHVVLFAAALIMWWPVVSPLPELPHLSYPGRMAYLFAHSLVPTVPAAFLTFAYGPLYSAYAEAPRLLAWLDPVQDQQLAGLVMKVGGGFLLWGVIAVLFFRWAAEDRTGGPDTLYWRDLEPDVEGARLAK
jgi:putative membrane protein